MASKLLRQKGRKKGRGGGGEEEKRKRKRKSGSSIVDPVSVTIVNMKVSWR